MKFRVIIKATVIKPVYVEADSKDEAIQLGHEGFTVRNEGPEEKYEEDMVRTEEVTDEEWEEAERLKENYE